MESHDVYIEETGRTLYTRIIEHELAMKNGDMKATIAAHAWDAQHQVNCDSVSAKEVVTHLWKRKTMEAIHIKTQPCTGNLDSRLLLNQIWLPFFHSVS